MKVKTDGENLNINEAITLAKSEVKDPYAQAYLQAIPEAIELDGTNGFVTQLIYALNNMAQWRGESARLAKTVIRDYIKQQQKEVEL
jgi:hypothetical protein